jgi:hypothetical protein
MYSGSSDLLCPYKVMEMVTTYHEIPILKMDIVIALLGLPMRL